MYRNGEGGLLVAFETAEPIMARPTVNCPHCREEVPALDDCVQCGRSLAGASAPQKRPPVTPSQSPFGQVASGTHAAASPATSSPGTETRPASGPERSVVQESRFPAVLVFGLFSILLALSGIHVVSGGRIGASHRVLFKESLSLMDTFANLNSLDPGQEYYRNFREGHPGLARVLRGVLVEELRAKGLEGRSRTPDEQKEIRACRAMQMMLEGARRLYYLQKGEELINVSEPAFYEKLSEAGLLGKFVGDPGVKGSGPQSYAFDAVLGQVTCNQHGGMGRDALGEVWDTIDYRLIFTEETPPELGGVAGLPDMYSPLLADQQARRDCIAKLAALSHAIQSYNSQYLGGTQPTSLDIKLLREMVTRKAIEEIPQCPRGQGRFVYEIRGYVGEVPTLFCTRHVQKFP